MDRKSLLLLGMVLCLTARSVWAEEDLSSYYPAQTAIYVELSEPGELADDLRSRPEAKAIAKKLKVVPAVAQALESQKYREFQTGMTILELGWGKPWYDVISSVAHNGVSFGFDPQVGGFVVIARAHEDADLHRIVRTVVVTAAADAARKKKPNPFKESEYRGMTVFEGPGIGIGVHDGKLVVTNNLEMGRSVLDALLDGRADSLREQSRFQQALESRHADGLAWSYFDVEYFRSKHPDEDLYKNRAQDPGGELILGGILSALFQTPYATGEVLRDGRRITLGFDAPFERAGIEEEREHFFGPDGAGEAAVPVNVPRQMLGLSVYRDLSQMWLRSGDLFDEKSNNELNKAETGLSTLFSGRSFSEEVLGSLSPRIQLVVARQEYAEGHTPALKLPAFALIAEMKDPKKTKRDFRRNFVNAIGFFNIAGATKGAPQLELDFSGAEGMELVSASPIVEVDEQTDEPGGIHYNFSPSMAFADSWMIIASTSQLAQDIATAHTQEVAEGTSRTQERTNTVIELSLDPVIQILQENRDHLISQNMLKEGHTREEAEADIDSMLGVGQLVEHGELKLSTTPETIRLQLVIDLHRPE
ncbi:MAG: hypothetical protein KDA78_12875 [Planctomycetaceae bacterium]|nr:hypothetical protein [Planctomycetaceae bacterium]